MTTPPDDLMAAVRAELASWHATHPEATFADIEIAVEEQIEQLRLTLIQEQTESSRREDQPACPHCGTTMVPRRRATRQVIVRGETAVSVERNYVVCPVCRTGLFPPG